MRQLTGKQGGAHTLIRNEDLESALSLTHGDVRNAPARYADTWSRSRDILD